MEVVCETSEFFESELKVIKQIETSQDKELKISFHVADDIFTSGTKELVRVSYILPEHTRDLSFEDVMKSYGYVFLSATNIRNGTIKYSFGKEIIKENGEK